MAGALNRRSSPPHTVESCPAWVAPAGSSRAAATSCRQGGISCEGRITFPRTPPPEGPPDHQRALRHRPSRPFTHGERLAPHPSGRSARLRRRRRGPARRAARLARTREHRLRPRWSGARRPCRAPGSGRARQARNAAPYEPSPTCGPSPPSRSTMTSSTHYSGSEPSTMTNAPWPRSGANVESTPSCAAGPHRAAPPKLLPGEAVNERPRPSAEMPRRRSAGRCARQQRYWLNRD